MYILTEDTLTTSTTEVIIVKVNRINIVLHLRATTIDYSKLRHILARNGRNDLYNEIQEQ